LAATGDSSEAEAIAAEIVRTHPEHTMITAILAPMVRAQVELRRRHPGRAVEELRTCAPYELGFVPALGPVYLRAQAHRAQGSGPEAAAEFQRILDHRGTDPFSPYYAVAPLGLARARVMAGDAEGGLAAYQAFLGKWGGADADIPI